MSTLAVALLAIGKRLQGSECLSALSRAVHWFASPPVQKWLEELERVYKRVERFPSPYRDGLAPYLASDVDAGLAILIAEREAKHGVRLHQEVLPAAAKAIRELAANQNLSENGRLALAGWRAIHARVLRLRDSDPREFEDLLIAVADGDLRQSQRLKLLAAKIAPLLPRNFGRPPSEESLAHEAFADMLSGEERQLGYTCDDGRFVDTMSVATSRRYGVPNFDPRRSIRRSRARLSATGSDNRVVGKRRKARKRL